MGKPTGFMEYERENSRAEKPEERIRHFNEFHTPLPEEERKRQGARCMDCGVPFCQSGIMLGNMVSGCPLNNLIPEWNDLIYRENREEALQRLLKTNNFPEFTARVCPAPCEAACTCSLHGDAVTIKENERAVIEYGFESGFMKPDPPSVRTGKKVAVIGSGPAGLAAADQLNKRGHLVTVFEKEDRPGGLLMYGIPNMKLEKRIVERRIQIMKEEGISFRTGICVGRDYKASKIKADFDAVILACGAGVPRDIPVPGRELTGIYFAVDYLKSVTRSLLDSGLKDGRAVNAGNRNVLVIGGGDTGNDCVGTAVRQGAKSVIQMEMLPQPPEERTAENPWPQWPKTQKTDYGQKEAIAVYGRDPRIYQATVQEFMADEKGCVKRAVCIRLEEKLNEKTKRVEMAGIPGSEFVIEADLILIAAGFTGTDKGTASAFGTSLNGRNTVDTPAGEYGTEAEGVFTAGDMHRGQSLVVWAIREGREAAAQADRYLSIVV